MLDTADERIWSVAGNARCLLPPLDRLRAGFDVRGQDALDSAISAFSDGELRPVARARL